MTSVSNPCVGISMVESIPSPYLTICRRIKAYDAAAGPMDTVRLVIDSKLQYTLYIYYEILAEGAFLEPDDIRQLPALVKMSDPNWLVCEGVESYSKYRMSIGYDVKNVVNVSLPPDSVRHSHFYELPRM